MSYRSTSSAARHDIRRKHYSESEPISTPRPGVLVLGKKYSAFRRVFKIHMEGEDTPTDISDVHL